MFNKYIHTYIYTYTLEVQPPFFYRFNAQPPFRVRVYNLNHYPKRNTIFRMVVDFQGRYIHLNNNFTSVWIY